MSKIILNDDLSKIGDWAIQWNMSFQTDPRNQAEEVTIIKCYLIHNFALQVNFLKTLCNTSRYWVKFSGTS